MSETRPNPWNETPAPGQALLPAHVYAASRDWGGYFRSLAHLGPRETLLAALSSFDADPPADASRDAIDLGCGDGRDTAELLRRGWRVLAIDASDEGLDRLRRRNDLVHPERLETRRASFEDVTLPPCTLLCASFSLPFCPAHAFPRLWAAVTGSIRPGGRFAGQLFGDADDWARLPDRTHHTPDQARALFEGFELERFQEERRDSAVDPVSHPKRWHVFHIVARRAGQPASAPSSRVS
ncbi:MAG: class I SAM-dependent methyltransferase [Planctomycetota bacterium]|nr:class I SAM-dependent methyltransferase [Planctomycetota bacterium]